MKECPDDMPINFHGNRKPVTPIVIWMQDGKPLHIPTFDRIHRGHNVSMA